MTNVNDREHLLKMLSYFKKRLHLLEEQSATYGFTVDPSVHIEIDDLHNKVAQIEKELERHNNPAQSKSNPTINLVTLSPSIPVHEPRSDIKDASEKVTFTNRGELFKKLEEAVTTQYILIDAPIGYGKTSLLEEFRRRYHNQDGWICAFVPIDRQQLTTPIQIMNTIGLQIKGYNPPTIETEEKYFIQVIKSIRLAQKGVILLFDGVEYLSEFPETEHWLSEYVLRVFENLKDLEFSHNFKVVFAGQNIKKRWAQKKINALDIPQLKLFDEEIVYNAVRETTAHAKLNLSPETIHHISRLILHHTGGHPKIVANIMNELRENEFGDWRKFLDRKTDRIFLDLTQAAIDDVIAYIPDDLRQVFDALSVFRKFDPDTLRFLMEQGEIPQRVEFGNGIKLARMIEDTGIRVWNIENGFYSSDIVRRLLVLRLRRKREQFLHLCDLAEQFYRDKAISLDERLGHLWVIEATYQKLLRCTAADPEPASAEIIEDIVATLYEDLEYTHSDARAAKLEHLRTALSEDKEWLYLASDVLGADAVQTILSQLQQRADAELGDSL